MGFEVGPDNFKLANANLVAAGSLEKKPARHFSRHPSFRHSIRRFSTHTLFMGSVMTRRLEPFISNNLPPGLINYFADF